MAVFKHVRRVGLVILLCMGTALLQSVHAEEFACRVQVDRSQLSGSEFSYLDDLERRIEEYLNTRDWTDDRYLPFERIACSMQVILLESVGLSEFRARVVVTSRRPIYGTAQSTVVTRISDSEWQFEYSRGTSLNFDLERYNALTSVLDFYAFVMLGYDYDTFSELGGTDYFEQARRVAEQAEGNGDPGWSAVGSQRNRRELINDLLDQRHRSLRQAYYQYHLNGLDRFVDEPEAARSVMIDALETIEELDRAVSDSYPLSLFFDTKYRELAAAFSDGEFGNRAYNLLTTIDPSHSSEYNALVE